MENLWDGLNKIAIVLTIIGFIAGNVSGAFIYKKIINKNSNNNNNNNNKNTVNNNGNNSGIQIVNNNGDINAR